MSGWKKYSWHLIALFVVCVWSVTYISTKVLINNGLSPQEIFSLRFLIAYLGIWFISPRRLFADNLKDEARCLFLGITGGSFYFFTENTALRFTLATNVAFILCTLPLITAVLTLLIYKQERASHKLIMGSLLAFVGVALVLCNDSFVLKFSPLGDFLTLLAALSWAFYSLNMRQLFARYSTAFITRKIFFYGLLTILPIFLWQPWQLPLASLLRPAVFSNLLFLGLLASLVCYFVWNMVLKRIGAVRASNYIYLSPLFTLIASAILLGERLTPVALLGAALIIGGVYWAEKKG